MAPGAGRGRNGRRLTRGRQVVAAVIASFVTVSIIVACSDGGSGGGTRGADPKAFCAGACSRVHECDTAQDLDTCKASCENANAATLPKLRADLVDGMSRCIATKDCRQVLESNIVQACEDEASALITPSSQAREFCNALASIVQKCSSEDISVGQCLDNFKIYSDATLAEAQSCTLKDCQDVVPCIAAATGGTVLQDGGVRTRSIKSAHIQLLEPLAATDGIELEPPDAMTMTVTLATAHAHCSAIGPGWSLPSRRELAQVFGRVGFDSIAWYWTSEWADRSHGWASNARDAVIPMKENARARVRCIRRPGL